MRLQIPDSIARSRFKEILSFMENLQVRTDSQNFRGGGERE